MSGLFRSLLLEYADFGDTAVSLLRFFQIHFFVSGTPLQMNLSYTCQFTADGNLGDLPSSEVVESDLNGEMGCSLLSASEKVIPINKGTSFFLFYFS